MWALGARILRIFFSLAATALLVTAVLAMVVANGGRLYHPAPADAIVVLGAAVWPGPRPSPALRGRAERAAELYKAGFAPYVVTTGGSAGRLPAEAEVAAHVLQEFGVSPSAIVMERTSTTTEESAQEVAKIARERGWSRLLVVSDGYHLLRSVWLFRREGLEATAAAADDWYYSTGSRTFQVLREVGAIYYLGLRWLFERLAGPGELKD